MNIGNKKNGFTLIELAIVLVVIGLLLAMVVKGKSLIDAAKMKGELNKLSKIEAAVNTYFTRYNRLPGFTGGNTAVTPDALANALVEESLLLRSDLEAFDGTNYWTFIGCKDKDGKAWDVGPINKYSHLCAYLSKSAPVNNINLTAPTDNEFESSFVCQIETSFDDKTVLGGLGRITDPNGYNGPMKNSSFKCSDKVIVGQQGIPTYVYKVW